MQTLTLPKIPKRSQPKEESQKTLIDQLLAEQNRLQTPVALFSDQPHPDLADHYRALIPLTKPGPGEQYAFEVSLDRCTGCKACVSACHSLNGLDDHEAWRDIGVLHGGPETPGWQQTVTTACHHCADPGCLNGCPVGAYEKDADTGIVRHLDDQCIGCSYCILKCPYDVPKFSKKRGIVRKCDMCHQRLAEGEAPACVQACPTEAIRIVNVPTQTAAPTGQSNLFESFRNPHSAIPDSSITQPTTRYVGRHIPASALAADRETLVPQHAHWPLVFMLTLTQIGIGLLASRSVGVSPTSSSFSTSSILTLTATGIFFLGMAASVLHLGQPLKAWRFFLGLRTSWLSREILAFSLFAPIPIVLSAIPFLPDFPFKSQIALITSPSALPLGLIAVFTSVMIYVDTRRDSWRFTLTATRFFGTLATFVALSFQISAPSFLTGLILAAIVFGKLIPELRILRLAEDDDTPWSPDRQSSLLQTIPLGVITRLRIALTLLGLFTAFANPWLALPILLVGEILERQLFFQSVHAPKMPGNFGPAGGKH